jgi:hypothetical protein
MGEVLIEGYPKPTAPDGDGLLRPRTNRATAMAVESFETRAPEIGAALQKVAEAMRRHLDPRRKAALPARAGAWTPWSSLWI